MRDITPLVAPRSIAVVGASTNPGKSGGILFANLLAGGFHGPLHPVNPRAETVMNRKAFPGIADIGEPVDLAYIVLPRHLVAEAVGQCIAAGVRAACIITAGFAEAGASGRADQAVLGQQARAGNLLLAGPNTIGMVNAKCGMMGSFVNFPHWQDGGISLFTQTGIFTGALMHQVMGQDAQRLPVGMSIDVGNKVDVDELDFLDYVADDPNTDVIGFYLESINRPRDFLEKAGEVGRAKPIVILKPGRTQAGARASSSHTGALATDDAVLDAGLRQFGVTRAEDEQEFLDMLKAHAMLSRPPGRRFGRRLAIATTSGALGVMATDLAVDFGFRLVDFTPETTARLGTILPDWLAPANPFDFWIGLDMKGPEEAHRVGLSAVIGDANADMVLCTLLAPPNADFAGFGEVMRAIRRDHPGKPIAMVIWGGGARDRWIAAIEGLNIPVFASTRAALRALAALIDPASTAEPPAPDV